MNTAGSRYGKPDEIEVGLGFRNANPIKADRPVNQPLTPADLLCESESKPFAEGRNRGRIELETVASGDRTDPLGLRLAVTEDFE